MPFEWVTGGGRPLCFLTKYQGGKRLQWENRWGQTLDEIASRIFPIFLQNPSKNLPVKFKGSFMESPCFVSDNYMSRNSSFFWQNFFRAIPIVRIIPPDTESPWLEFELFQKVQRGTLVLFSMENPPSSSLITCTLHCVAGWVNQRSLKRWAPNHLFWVPIPHMNPPGRPLRWII